MHEIIKEDISAVVVSLGNQWQKLSGATVLITGAAGFLGTYFLGVLQFLNKGVLVKPCRVIALDNYISGSKKEFLELENDKHITFVTQDVTKPFNTDEPVDYIIHAAGVASPVYYQKFPLETIEVAVTGTKNMLECARQKNVKSFIFFSSSEIYGDPHKEHIPTPETYRGYVSSVGPRACYDESKRLGETICMTYFKLYGVPVKIVRPFNVYGPCMRLDDYRVIPTFLGSGINGKPLPVHDKGVQTRTFCYVSDAVAAFFSVLLSEQNGEIFNVGNDDEEIGMFQLAQAVAKLFNPPIEVALVKYPDVYPADEPQRRCPDLTKIKTELGYVPRVNLQEGLRRTLTWFREDYGA